MYKMMENHCQKLPEDLRYVVGGETSCFYEAIPVWERAYAVTETKRCVEGAAGTRGADKTIVESPFVRLPGNHFITFLTS